MTAPIFPVQQGTPEPDLSERRRHNERIMAALREAAETEDNVVQRRVPWRK